MGSHKLLYAFRGWMAFVAFMDLGTAGRCYIERRSFLSAHPDTDYAEDDWTSSRMLGMYSLLKAVALIHCTLYIHYRPVVSLGHWALALTTALYGSEALYFRSTTLSFHVLFPGLLNALTLAGLLYLPGHINLWGPTVITEEDENSLLLRQLGRQARQKRRAAAAPPRASL